MIAHGNSSAVYTIDKVNVTSRTTDFSNVCKIMNRTSTCLNLERHVCGLTGTIHRKSSSGSDDKHLSRGSTCICLHSEEFILRIDNCFVGKTNVWSLQPPHTSNTIRTRSTCLCRSPQELCGESICSKNLNTTTTNRVDHTVRSAGSTSRESTRSCTSGTKHNNIIVNRKLLCVDYGVCTVECNRTRERNTFLNNTGVFYNKSAVRASIQ